MAFWTMTEDGHVDITLCETCALSSTNEGFALAGVEAFPTMEDAAVMLTMLAAITAPGLTLSSCSTGECGNCGARIEAA